MGKVSVSYLSNEQINQIICDKLLSWVARGGGDSLYWEPRADKPREVPTFESWEDAGLILDKFARMDFKPELKRLKSEWWCGGYCGFKSPTFQGRAQTGPLAVRAAAIEYLNTMGV